MNNLKALRIIMTNATVATIVALHSVPTLARDTTASYTNITSCVLQLKPTVVRPNGAIQIERFMRAIDKIRATMAKSTSVDNFIDVATAEDLRGSFFIVQDLFRHYDKIGYGKQMRTWYERLHTLQREIGGYGDQIDFIKAAKKLNADPEAIAVKEDDLVKQKKKLAAMLVDGNWYPPASRNQETNYDLMETYLRSRKWHSEERDVLDMLKVMIKAIKKIEKGEYDFDELEGDGSIHAYRRAIRRTPAIMSLATYGLFQLDKRNGDFRLNEYVSLKSTPVANAAFTQLPENPNLNYVVLIPQHYYLAISQVIDDLGKVKKIGQIIEMLTEAYYRGKVDGCETKARARARVTDLVRSSYGADYFDYNEAAEQIHEQVERTGLLKEYRRLLKDARRELKAKFRADDLLDD